jgi:hypothetical protein
MKTTINIYSETNTWMDATFTVDAKDEARAQEVLNKAWEAYWEDEDAENECYGDWLENAMQAAGIEYEVTYADDDSDEDEF